MSRIRKVTIYHHEIHKKLIRKSAILKLQTPGGVIEGHDQCATFLENEVKNLLLTDAGLDPTAQNVLLDDIEPCFTEADKIPSIPPICTQPQVVMASLASCTKSNGRQWENH